jgi:hypothetical protein
MKVKLTREGYKKQGLPQATLVSPACFMTFCFSQGFFPKPMMPLRKPLPHYVKLSQSND